MVRIVEVLILTTGFALTEPAARGCGDGLDIAPPSSAAVWPAARSAMASPPVQVPDRSAESNDAQAPPPQGPPDRDWRGERGGFRITSENREHVIAVIGDLRPLSDEERSQLMEMSFDELRKVLAEQGGMILGMARLRETQPELYKLRVADINLLRSIQKEIENVRTARERGEAEPLATAEEHLRALVSEQIDLRFAIREREILALEERVVAMRQELERERQQPREELIDRRLEMFENGERGWRREGPRDASPPESDQPGRPPGPASGGSAPDRPRDGGSL